MKQRRFRKNLLTVLIMAACISGMVFTAYAESSQIDVTFSTIPGVTSPDPYTYYTRKANSNAYYVVTLTSLTGTSACYIRAYDQDGTVVSPNYRVTSSDVNITKNYSYNASVLSGDSYRLLFFMANEDYVMAHATGTYIP